ncbi:hypothetical protein MXB_2587 [Myxobolus squamalis]|nr:hypothetical protein MXB_2587 [Myxobolus squamalis]
MVKKSSLKPISTAKRAQPLLPICEDPPIGVHVLLKGIHPKARTRKNPKPQKLSMLMGTPAPYKIAGYCDIIKQ